MQRAITQPADLSGNALAELKQWLGITQSTEDTLLSGLLHAGMGLCESFTRQMPLETDFEEIVPASDGWQCLETRPVRAITSVAVIGKDGTRAPLASGQYEIELDAAGVGRVRVLAPGEVRSIAVSFVAGIAPDWAAMPDGLRHGVIRAAAHLYQDRDGTQTTSPPASISALWRPWRLARIA
ncbi:MAG: hypothetical protein C0510_03590 [Erythrobacter sp.]|nr:hypothetical protein [Erythrobacter sp.]